MIESVYTGSVDDARDRFREAAAQLSEAAGPGAAADEVIAALATCEEARRSMDRAMVGMVADLQRRGVFAERGYRSPVGALGDLLRWERFEARRRVAAAESVCAQVGLGGEVLRARLPATATVFAAGEAGLRHVEAIARVLDSAPARRLDAERWAGAEVQLAAKASSYTPSELQTWGTQLIELLDQDGAEPDDSPPAQINELRLSRFRTRPGEGRSPAATTTPRCSTRSPPWSMPVPPLATPTTSVRSRNGRPRPSPRPAPRSCPAGGSPTPAAAAHSSS
jgi:hypothetical protein